MKNWERLGIAVMSFWALFALHQLMNAVFKAHHWKGMSAGDWGTWIGGIGTIGTLAFAVVIARTGERKRIAEQMDLARVVAAEFWLILPRALGDVESVEDELKSMLGGVNPFSAYQCANALNNIRQWDTEKLAKIVCLPNHVAAKLAMASTEIRVCADDLLFIQKNFMQLNLAQRKSEIVDVLISLDCIKSYLKDAYTQCDNALLTRVI